MFPAKLTSSNHLNILLLTLDKYPPFRPAASAIFAKEMINRGHRIDWILQAEKSCKKTKKISFGKGIMFIGPTEDRKAWFWRLRKHLLDFSNDLRIFALLKENRYDLIQVKDKFISALLVILIVKILKIDFFYWLAFPIPEASIHIAKQGITRFPYFKYLKGHSLKFILYNVIIPNANHVFVQSEQMKKDIIQKGIPGVKLTPIPGSLNFENIPYRKKPADIFAQSRIYEKSIVYLGTLNKMRRLDFLLRVVQKVLTRFPNVKLYLIGRGDMPEHENFLKGEMARLGLEDAVEFTGYLPMRIAWEYIRYANVCVSPIYPTQILNVGSPTKIIEYMAMGKPVVANDHPEQRLVISESGAGICVTWNEDEFAEAIIEILKKPEMGKAMGIKGRRYVEKFRNNYIMADIVENRYKSLKCIPRNL